MRLQRLSPWLVLGALVQMASAGLAQQGMRGENFDPDRVWTMLSAGKDHFELSKIGVPPPEMRLFFERYGAPPTAR
jgi:hypothetical protein